MSTTGQPPITVLVSENLLERDGDLDRRYPGVRFVPVPLADRTMREEYRDADAMFRSVMDEDLFDEILESAPDLRWIQISAAGFDWMGGAALERRVADGLVVTRCENSLNVTIAEYCIGALLGLARNIPGYVNAQRDREWIRLMGRDVTGSTVAVFGTGSIGGQVAWRARALGATVIGVSRSGAPAEHFDEVVDRHAIMDVLPRADFVVLAMPLTPETRGMFGAEQFAAMPDHAGLVNVGRGALTDEAALVTALETGQIGGAYLDVFVEEPLPADHPLWGAPNCILTPHVSYRSEATSARVMVDFTDNLERFVAGEALRGTMKQPELGY